MNSLIPMGLVILLLVAIAFFFFLRTKQLERSLADQQQNAQAITGMAKGRTEDKLETTKLLDNATQNVPTIPIFKILTPEDLPKDLELEDVKILQANVIQNGNPIIIKEPIITVAEPGEKITINLLTETPKEDGK